MSNVKYLLCGHNQEIVNKERPHIVSAIRVVRIFVMTTKTESAEHQSHMGTGALRQCEVSTLLTMMHSGVCCWFIT